MIESMIKNKKILVLGASGLLGKHLVRFFSKNNLVLGSYLTNTISDEKSEEISFVKLNQLSRSELETVVGGFSPDIIFNTTSFANTDGCEERSEHAYNLNVVCARNLSEVCENRSCQVVHISTDHLFDGKVAFRSEEDQVMPLNVYAETKSLAEDMISNTKGSLIIRTNFFGGSSPAKKSFSSYIIDELFHNRQIKLFGDSYYSPISILDLCFYMDELLWLKKNGVYNICSNSRVSKYEFGVLIAELFGLSSELIINSKLANIDLPAKRPLDMSLSSRKLSLELGKDIVSIENTIQSIKDNTHFYK